MLKKKLDVFIQAGKSIQINLEKEVKTDEFNLSFSLPRRVDVVLPRATAIMRHGGKRVKHTLDALLGLDSLLSNPGMKRLHKVFQLDANSKKYKV